MKEIIIKIDEIEEKELEAKLKAIRWPQRLSQNKDVGLEVEKVKRIVDFWLNDYDWNTLEKHLNQFRNFSTYVNKQKLHFIYEKGKSNINIPLLLLHGWPDSILRYTKVIEKLKEGFKFNGENISFDIIIPSIPGFGFSEFNEGLNNEEIANIMYLLMHNELNYDEFIVSGGDIGSGIARYMAKKYPNSIKGLHLTDIGIIKDVLQKNKDLTEDELKYKKRASEFFDKEAGYMNIQSTKPQTIAYGLNDSPAGLISWIGEKYYSWSGYNLLSMEDIINNIYLYWHTKSIGSSMNIYLENATRLPRLGTIDSKTGVSIFGEDIMIPPHSYIKSQYNLVYFNEIEQGGHFPAIEIPDLFANEIISFVKQII